MSEAIELAKALSELKAHYLTRTNLMDYSINY